MFYNISQKVIQSLQKFLFPQSFFSILFLQLFKYLKQMCMETLYVLSFDVELTLSINESIHLDHIIYCLSSKDKAYRSKTISIMWSLSVS